MDWRIEDAENQLGTVIDRALSEGPQTIRREDAAVVVVSAAEYQRLSERRSPIKRVLFEGPSLEGLDLSRDKSLPRDIDFGTR